MSVNNSGLHKDSKEILRMIENDKLTPMRSDKSSNKIYDSEHAVMNARITNYLHLDSEILMEIEDLEAEKLNLPNS